MPAVLDPSAQSAFPDPPPGLHLVATPIGNLGDISARAAHTLRRADKILCEDTRVTAKLVQHLGIATPLLSYHEHNAGKLRPRLLADLQAGSCFALVSDAGTPLISDPGYKLVRAALDASVTVSGVPGPVAAIHALTLSGLPSQAFAFAGFLPTKTVARRQALTGYQSFPGTLILYESASRLTALLGDIEEVLGGERQGAVARELTKRYEEVRRGHCAELAEHYRKTGPPKGELVVLIGPRPKAEISDAALDQALEAAAAHQSRRTAIDQVSEALGLPRTRVYRRALEIL